MSRPGRAHDHRIVAVVLAGLSLFADGRRIA